MWRLEGRVKKWNLFWWTATRIGELAAANAQQNETDDYSLETSRGIEILVIKIFLREASENIGMANGGSSDNLWDITNIPEKVCGYIWLFLRKGLWSLCQTIVKNRISKLKTECRQKIRNIPWWTSKFKYITYITYMHIAQICTRK